MKQNYLVFFTRTMHKNGINIDKHDTKDDRNKKQNVVQNMSSCTKFVIGITEKVVIG